MQGSCWHGNILDRSGTAVFFVGPEKVSIELRDVDDYHRLDALIKKIAEEERKGAQDRLTRRVLSALGPWPATADGMVLLDPNQPSAG